MKNILLAFLFLLLIYTRFVGLDWGLPYPTHPDERNMANALQQLQCDQFSIFNFQFSIKNCFNPHFFAYGQFPLYVGYVLIQIYHLMTQKLFIPITFTEAVMSLRVISAVASILTVFVLMKMMKFFNGELSIRNRLFFHFSFLFFIFQPYFIQFSHFGTTESFLMLFYLLIIYHSLQLFNRMEWKNIFFLALSVGLALATKVSAIIFLLVTKIHPWGGFSFAHQGYQIRSLIYNIRNIIVFLILTMVITVSFSPHNLISLKDFSGNLRYESSVALGSIKVFYTRQFEGAMPVWFQLTKIFPYALGWPQYLLAVLGFFSLSWKKKEVNLLRLAFLIYFIPTSFLYVKWTRFMAPIFPLLSIFAILFLSSTIKFLTKSFEKLKMKSQKLKVQLKVGNFLFFIFYFLFLVPGIAYLSVYQNPDIRFTASEWIYKTIPANSYILSETANVVDIPVESQKSPLHRAVAKAAMARRRQGSAGRAKVQSRKSYQMISFNFYDLDRDHNLQNELHTYLRKADYIFVPSRRIFKNHLQSQYPLLNDYYQKLFSGELGFEKTAEFTSYPRIELFGKTLIEFSDEGAEETWSVFDHPVVRIYRKVM